MNSDLILIGILFILYTSGSVNLTQLLLLLALLSTTNYCCQGDYTCNCNNQTTV